MTVTLASDIGVAQERITLSAPIAGSRGDLFRFEDEMVEFRGYQIPMPQLPKQGYQPPIAPDRSKVRLRRGVYGTVRVRHDAGIELLGVLDAYVAGDDIADPDPFVEDGPGGSTPPLAEVLAAGPGTGGQTIGAIGEGLSLLDGMGTGQLGQVLTVQGDGLYGLWQPKVYVGRARAVDTVDTTSGDPTILNIDFSQADVGSTIKGPGIPANTTIDFVDDGVSATLNNNATATATVTVRLATPDPGAVGAGNIWLRAAVFPSGEAGVGYALYVRNEGDSAWRPVASAVFDNAANLRGATINKDNAADAYEIRTWDAAGGFRNDVSVYDTAMEFIHTRANGTAASRVAIGDYAGSGEGAVTIEARSADGLSPLAVAVVGPNGIDLTSGDGTVTLFSNTNNILMPSLPTSDPAIAGALWVDTAAGFVLKVSQG